MTPPLPNVSKAATVAALRSCSPVVRDDQRCVVQFVLGDPIDRAEAERLAENGWRIDPTDATGRAHLAWAVADTMPSRLGSLGGATWSCESRPSEAMWALRTPTSTHWFASHMFPFPTHLDPTADTRLADGSRWVDAAALVLVANHVLGGSDV